MTEMLGRRRDPWATGLLLGGLGLVFVYVAAATHTSWLGLAAAVTGFAAGFAGPLAGFVTIVLDTVFASAFRRDLAVPLLRPNEVALAGALAGLAVWGTRQAMAGGGRGRVRRLLIWTPIDGGFVAVLVLYSAVALVVRRNELDLAAFGAALLPVQGWIAYRLALAAVAEGASPGRVVALLLGCATVVVGIGVLQLLDVAGAIRLFAAWFDSHHLATVSRFHRMTSVVGTYSGLAAFLGLVLTAVAAAWRRGRLRSIARPAWLAAGVCVATLGLLLTGTWAAWIGAALAILIVLLPPPPGWRSEIARLTPRIRVGVGLTVLVILVLAAPVIAGRLERQFGGGDLIPESLITRIELWRDLFIPAIAAHPLFGVGLTIPDDFGWNTQESLYLQWLFQGGIVGTAGWVILVATVVRELRRAVRGTGQWIARAALAGVIAMLVMGFVNAFLLLSVSSETLWWLVGVAIAGHRFAPRSDRLEEVP